MARYQNPDEPEFEPADPAPPAASNTEAPSEVTRTIKVGSLPKLQERVAVMVRKAAKLGLAPLVLTVGKPRIEYRVEEVPGTDTSGGIGPAAPDTRRVPYEVVDITLRGESPKLPGGWRFVATIDHDGPLNVVRAVPGGAVPILYRTRPPICEHCRLSRDRRDTFVVENDAHKLVQVGRSCLVDFMGHKSAAAIADLVTAYSDLWSDLDDPDSLGGGAGRDLMDPRAFLAFASDEVAEFGFISRRVADEKERPSTADLTLLRMNPPRGHKYVPPTDAGKEKAEKVIAWAQTIDPKTPNDYLYNLKATLAKDAFSWRDVGLAASAISAYDRDMARSRSAGDRGSGEHFGTVGERERVKVRVERIFDLHSDEYGTSYLHMMRTVPEGHVAKWKTGTERLEEGKEYDFVCTIAEHGEYKGTKQTILKRCAPYVSPEEKKAEKELAAVTADLAFIVESEGVAAKSILEAPSYERPARAKERAARQKLLAGGLLQVEARDVRQWDGSAIKVDFLAITPAGLRRALWLGLEIVDRTPPYQLRQEPDVGIALPVGAVHQKTPLVDRGLLNVIDDGGALALSPAGREELSQLRAEFVPVKGKRRKNPAPARGDVLSPDEVAALPVGTLVWPASGDGAKVVIAGRLLTPISVLPARVGEGNPGGAPPGEFDVSFTIISIGDGQLPNHASAQRRAMDWWDKRQVTRRGNPARRAPSAIPDLAWAQGMMEQAWKQEGLEASTLDEAIEMYAWDLGYQGQSMPPWLTTLAKHRGIDVDGEHGSGADAKLDPRRENPADDTSAAEAAHTVLREYGFGGSSGDRVEEEPPRRVTPQGVKTYCSYQDRFVSDANAKIAAAIVNRRLAAWHAENGQ